MAENDIELRFVSANLSALFFVFLRQPKKSILKVKVIIE